MRKAKKVNRRPWRGEESQQDYTSNLIKGASSAWRRILCFFADWLLSERGLAKSSITLRVGSAKKFVEAQKGPGGVRTLKTLTVNDVEDFCVEYAKNHGLAAKRSMQAGVRHFLRFAASRGWVKGSLVNAVMPLRSYRLSHLPRGLDRESICKLVSSSAEKSVRTHALILIFVVYGVRCGQVSELRLEDIDWQRKTITFRAHKRGKLIRHTLVPSIAEALSKYLLNERPKINSQSVFLRSRKPHLPLGPSAIAAVVVDVMQCLDLEKGVPQGPHALRHAFATRLLHNGQPLKVIADLLGHRSLESVSVYAKVDHSGLLEVAEEWPEVLS